MASPKLLFLLFPFGISLAVAQQLYLFNITEPIEGLSSTCISVLNQALACDPYLLSVTTDEWESDDVLGSICTSACLSAWSTYLRRVNGACGTSRFDGGNGYLYLPAFNIEPVYEQYQLLCLKNSAGKYCNAVIRDIMGIDPDTQTRSSGAPAPASTAACDGCFLSSLAQVLQMPISSAAEYATALSGLEATCHTTIALTSPTMTAWAIPATTSPGVSGCQGTQYSIRSGDTCQSIALSQGFSTTQLLVANDLTAYCRDFPTSGTVCLPDALKCTPYQPKSGDTCNSIAANNSISFAQVISWNPELGQFCGNMDTIINKTMVLCLSNPGGSWVNPSPITTISASTTDTIFTQSPTPMSQFNATVSPIPTLLPNENYVTPYANATRLDCVMYVTPPVLLNTDDRTFSYACADVASAYGITLSDLLTWNPGINQTGGFFDPCELSGQEQYCVQPLAEIPADTTANCSLTALAEPAWSCAYYAYMHNITKAAVVAWNPSVGPDCSNYTVGTTYCAAVQHFISPDTISTCAYWAMANDSIPATCATMEAQYKLDHGRFVAWNPSVLTNCSGAVAGFDYCVGTPTVHPGFPV
ncbi:LysM domain-containing protein [Pleurostoma richardsiae]|uniref:LysM domain-containing protein n=1 Tax=Pleurostoma richardsiae TaxID=41990 RepID=A0AA38RCP1_9PEZI|nr:LysM domain-containing protein [Pleurostoma richardsiae]